jgi:hypothetical protein
MAQLTAEQHALLLSILSEQEKQRAQLDAITDPGRTTPPTYDRNNPASYDIDNPPQPPHGRLCSEIKLPSYLEWNGDAQTTPLSDILPQIERFCALQHASSPVLLATSLFTKDAAAWVSRTYKLQHLTTISWADFKLDLHTSTLTDLGAPQRLLDDIHSLQQHDASIRTYVQHATDLHNKGQTHFWLRKCPAEYWCEMLRAGLSPDLQHRMIPIDASSTFASVCAEALRVGTPLEEFCGGILEDPPKSPRPEHASPFEGLSPEESEHSWASIASDSDDEHDQTPPDASDERSASPDDFYSAKDLADWERLNLDSEQRRTARIARDACLYCGLNGHRRTSCPTAPRRNSTH